MALRIIDRGSGTPVVVIPGVQGRWEWMKPAIDALAERGRVITFSLADEPTSGARFDEAHGFSCYVEQVREVMDAVGLDRATICGVSYGGLVAAAFASRHPERTRALVLVSALSPWWTPNRRVAFYLRAPRLLTPLFLAASLRLYREFAAALGPVRGAVVAVSHAWRALTHMFSPVRMARRARLMQPADLSRSVAPIAAPTLIVTGEPALDLVVPVAETLKYARLVPRARVATLARTGHLGLVTRPEEFASLVVGFAEDNSSVNAGLRRQIG
jgi:pimeloyl-ACP methyl ester carboxylesterase